MIPEDDESVIDDDLSDAMNPDPKQDDRSPVSNFIEPKGSIVNTSTDNVNGGDLLSQLGDFNAVADPNAPPSTEVYCIPDWEALMHRYKPENIRKFIN